MKTLLGQKYLALEPKGPGQLRATARSRSPHRVLLRHRQRLQRPHDDDRAHRHRPAGDVPDDPRRPSSRTARPDVKAALDGLTRLSRTIACRDAELDRLLAAANSVTRHGRRSATRRSSTLIKDADLLLVELDARRDDIHTLFLNTSALAQQITGLVRDNRAQLKPALDQLTKVARRAAEARAGPQRHDPGDGAVHPGVRQRRWATAAGSTPTSQNLTTPVEPGRPLMERRPLAPAPPRWASSPKARRRPRRRGAGGRRLRRSGPGTTTVAVTASSPAPSVSSRAPTCASSASRSARSTTVTPRATSRGHLRVRRASTRCPPTPRPPSSRPSLVSDRYVQLLPAYTGGPAMADHAQIGAGPHRRPGRARPDLHRASTTCSWRSVPTGANKDGALVAAARHRRRQPRRPGPEAARHHPRPQPALQTLSGGPQRPVRHGEEPAVLHLDARHERRPGAPAQHRPRDRRPTQLDGERDDLEAALKNLAVALSEVSAPSSTTTAPSLTTNLGQLAVGDRHGRQASATPSPRR